MPKRKKSALLGSSKSPVSHFLRIIRQDAKTGDRGQALVKNVSDLKAGSLPCLNLCWYRLDIAIAHIASYIAQQ